MFAASVTITERVTPTSCELSFLDRISWLGPVGGHGSRTALAISAFDVAGFSLYRRG
jgi:hypothetical protein